MERDGMPSLVEFEGCSHPLRRTFERRVKKMEGDGKSDGDAVGQLS